MWSITESNQNFLYLASLQKTLSATAIRSKGRTKKLVTIHQNSKGHPDTLLYIDIPKGFRKKKQDSATYFWTTMIRKLLNPFVLVKILNGSVVEI